ncbi:hypothetical protein V6N11_053937 [Hibiscus sabdariffa]|uniref:Uncharacterized protein n=1 Tax=Hibiscus sabdariffa TaxID=183260 RepID=A0ABR2S2C9_9ROSI
MHGYLLVALHALASPRSTKMIDDQQLGFVANFLGIFIFALTTRKPDSNDDNPRNKNPAKPNATEISDCTQNEAAAVHVSVPFNVCAAAVPAESADNNK